MEDACRKGDVEAVRLMCRVDMKRAVRPDNAGVTPLHRAAADNHVELCEFLISSKANVNAVDRYIETPLKKAVYNGHVDTIRYLLEAGADLNHEDTQGKMALHHASEQGHLHCVEMMLEMGAAANAEVTGYLTPLHFAAMNGHSGVVKVLIGAGALIDAQGGQSNQAAIHMAAEGGHTQTVKILLDEGADYHLEDSQGRRAQLCCADRKTRDVFDAFVLRRTCRPAMCVVSGPGILPVIEASDAMRFIIQPRDMYGMELRDPGGLIGFSVEIQDRTTGEVHEAHVEPCPQFYNSICYWNASRAGQYAVHVRQENALADGVSCGQGKAIAIGGSPFLVEVTASKLDPYCTRADGKGVTRTEAAVTASFTVFGRDRFNNPSPGHAIEVYIEPQNRIPTDLRINDLGTGEYAVTYTAPHASGLQKISVAVSGGKHIYNSPFVTLISPGDAYPPNCEVAGAGLVRGGRGMLVTFRIHARDVAGNHLIEGGLNWAVRVYPEIEKRRGTGAGAGGVGLVECTICDHKNGAYSCSFRAMVAAKHSVRVMLGAKHVRGSPYVTSILEMPDWEAEEVAQFVEQIGFPEYRAAFINQDVRGFMLTHIDQDVLEHELGIFAKGHQSRILSEIKKLIANTEVEEGEEVSRIEDAMLVRLGITDTVGRRNLFLACENFAEDTRLAVDPEYEEILFRRLKIEVYGYTEEIIETIRDMVEVSVSSTMQEILTELYAGKTNDPFGVSRSLRSLESHLKQNVEAKVRAATMRDEVDAGDEGAATLNDSRPGSRG